MQARETAGKVKPEEDTKLGTQKRPLTLDDDDEDEPSIGPSKSARRNRSPSLEVLNLTEL